MFQNIIKTTISIHECLIFVDTKLTKINTKNDNCKTQLQKRTFKKLFFP